MNYNFHAHTTRCGHATGGMREYVETAIAHGILRMGFSEHAPFLLRPETSWRCPPDRARDYIEEALALKEKFKDRIELHVGFEMEYYPTHFTEMLDFVRSLGAEYLILGQHYTDVDESFWSFGKNEDEEHLSLYADHITVGMRSGFFTYVAHPDLFHYLGDAKIYRREMRKICRAAKETGVPLEINFLGLRENRIYPRASFWEIAGEESSPVVFGFDSHAVPAAADLASLPQALEMVKRYSLSLVDPPVLRPLEK